jgi:hypothetical protein
MAAKTKTIKTTKTKRASSNAPDVSKIANDAMDALTLADSKRTNGQALLMYTLVKWAQYDTVGEEVCSSLYTLSDHSLTPDKKSGAFRPRERAYRIIVNALLAKRVTYAPVKAAGDDANDDAVFDREYPEPQWHSDKAEQRRLKGVFSAALRAVEHQVGLLVRTGNYDALTLRSVKTDGVSTKVVDITDAAYNGHLGKWYTKDNLEGLDVYKASPATNTNAFADNKRSIAKFGANAKASITKPGDKNAPKTLRGQRAAATRTPKPGTITTQTSAEMLKVAKLDDILMHLQGIIQGYLTDKEMMARVPKMTTKNMKETEERLFFLHCLSSRYFIGKAIMVGDEIARQIANEEEELATKDARRHANAN